MTQLGRGVASLADVTLGGLIPAAIQQVGYPIARIGRSEEEAKAATQRLIGAVDQPFGKAFGVTATPEYQQESGRKLLDFIGQNFQKNSKWISEKTGLPQADVESYLGSATVAAPKVVPPVARAIQGGVAPAIEKAIVGAKMPFEKQLQARRERMSAEDYARGPQIDALAEAQRLKFAMNPVDVQAGVGPKLTSMLAGEKGVENITLANKNRVREVALNDMGLPLTSQLDGATAFKQARAQVEKPYRDVAKLPIQQADDAMIQRLEAIRSDMDVIGAKDYAPAISKIVDDAISKTQTGLTGEKLLKNISVLRERAKKTYNNKSATTEALDVADTNLKIATELESMIDNSIFNPTLLGEYRDARQKMARTYAYEGATDFNTGIVDVSKLARITEKNNALTGDIASIGKIAGNFPEMFTKRAAKPLAKVASSLGRTGLAGTLGGLAGYALDQGYTGAAIGSVLGAGAGRYGQSVAAQRIASPGYQAGLQLRDARLPVNQLAASMQPIPQDRAVVPYQPEVFGPSDAGNANKLRIVSYDANGVPIYMADERGQGFTMPPSPSFGAAPSPYAQRALPNEIPQQIYRAQKNAELAQEFRAAAERKPAGRGTPLVFDSAGNLVEAPPVGTGSVVGAPTSLESAVKKLSGIVVPETQTTYKTQTISPKTGAKPYTRITKKEGETTFERGVSQAFDLTSEERIAWNKSKADLAVASPELKGLTDKAIAEKMMDRQWVSDTIGKIREKAQAFDEISKRASTAQAARDASMKREQMMDLLADLEDSLRPARPVQKGGQGPKTRAFQRNMLTPEQEIQNALVK
jgi:hypothetical protein